jgi:hypothetical protein
MRVFKKVFLKYKIMIVRSKISFMALNAGKTINELFHSTILKSHSTMVRQKLIDVDRR